MDILDNYFMYVKTTQLLTEEEKYQIIPCICKYITIFNTIHEDEIELTLFTNDLIDTFAKSVAKTHFLEKSVAKNIECVRLACIVVDFCYTFIKSVLLSKVYFCYTFLKSV